MTKIVSFETALLAQKKGYDVYASTKYNPDGQIVLHDNSENVFAPTQDELQTWLETKGMYVSCAPEMYFDGINWNWQILWYLPEKLWDWVEETDDDGKVNRYPRNICTGTGYYGDNGEYPTRHLAIEAALVMALKKLDILYRNNSIDGLAKLYEVDNNTMLNRIRPFSAELGDWSFREFTEEQLSIIVSKIGQPPQ
jgi:hypothetical protein